MGFDRIHVYCLLLLSMINQVECQFISTSVGVYECTMTQVYENMNAQPPFCTKNELVSNCSRT